MSLCPSDHKLKLRSRCYSCDTCGNGIVKNGPSMCCVSCDYDACPHHSLSEAGAEWNATPKDTNGQPTKRDDLTLKQVGCPKGHALVLGVRNSGWICDKCEKSFPQGSISCWCATCDYDECAHHSTGLSEEVTKPEPRLSDPLDAEEVAAKMQTVMTNILASDVTKDAAALNEVATEDVVFRNVVRSRFPAIKQNTKRRSRKMPAPVLPPSVPGGPGAGWFGGISSTQWTKPSVYKAPYVSIKNDPHSKAVYISHCAISASVTPFIARCTVTLTFTNTDDRDLEGEVIFPLPEDAAVCGYGLEFGGQMVPASLVESKKAEKVYEEEVKKGVDPGLMQKVAAGGNSFKTRVYPLPRRGTRRVSLTYTQPLDTSITADHGMFSFASLNIGERQEQPVQVSLQADIASPSDKAPILEGMSCPGAGMHVLDPENAPSSFFLSYQEKSQTAKDATLRVAVPLPSGDDAVILVEPAANGDGWFYLINDVTPTPLAPAPVTCQQRNLCIVWDASLSRLEANTADELALLADMLQACDDRTSTIDLFLVRNEVEVLKNLVPAAALNAIRAAPYDGATNLQKLNDHQFDAAYLSRFERVLLFSDGQSTMGEGRIQCLEPGKNEGSLPPIFTFNSSARFNRSQLHHYWAASTGGTLLRVSPNMGPENRVAMVSKVLGDAPVPRVLSVMSQAPGVADDCNPIKPSGISGARFTVTGKIPNLCSSYTQSDTMGTTSITVLIEVGSSHHAADVREYELPPLGTVKPSAQSVVSLLWAQQRIGELEVFPDRNGAQILDLGRRFGLVTASSSLLVLETLAQHVEHRVEPHPARTAIYAQYHAQIAKTQNDEAERVHSKVQGAVLGYWKSRESWVQQTFSLPSRNKSNASKKGMSMPTGASRSRQHCSMAMDCAGAVPDDSYDEYCMAEEEACNSMASSMSETACRRSSMQCAPAPPPCASPSAACGGAPMMQQQQQQQQQSPGGGHAGPSVRANTSVKYWTPDTPYLRAINSAGSKVEDQYLAYLTQRPEYQKTPAFYFDVGGFFLNPEHLTPERRAVGIRVLSNIAELGLDNSRILRVLGYKLYEAKEWQLALEVFCKVALFRPQEPQSFRDLGLTFLECGRYQEAVDLLWRTVIMEVNHSFAEIEMECLWELRDALARSARRAQQVAKGQPLPPSVQVPTLLLENWQKFGFDKDCSMDLRITMGWDQDNVDLDLHVIEPTGEEAYYGHRHTTIGGLMSRDFTQGYGPESYVLRKALSKGQYKIKTNYYGSHQPSLTGPAVAILSITTNFLRANQKTVCTLIRLNESKDNGQIGSVTI